MLCFPPLPDPGESDARPTQIRPDARRGRARRVYGCGKEEPKKAAEAPKAAAPAEETVTVKIGHAGPLTGGIAHLGKDDENGVRLADRRGQRQEDQDRRQDRSSSR